MKEIEILLYESDGKIEVVMKDETIWATQKAIADLFDVGISVINKHLKYIYESGEHSEERTISKMEIVQNEGTRSVSRETIFYNLDVIISVGYRVNSQKATSFRIWQQVTDIFAEIIQDSADREKEHMGLTTWKNSLDGRILQSDVIVAKN